VTSIGVVAHKQKSLGGGLEELRSLLAERGFSDPLWHEVTKSRRAPGAARRTVKEGADLLLLWGGDGTVQRCIDALVGSEVVIGVLPAGTANLLASNLGLPMDLAGALDVALYGGRRALDVGLLNGERFAVMAGLGFDANMMRGAKRTLKRRFGRVAYVWSAASAVRSKAARMRIEIDGRSWFDGRASCVLFGNFGTITGGLTVFAEARPDDGALEVAVVTARGPTQWARVLTALVAGRADRSRFVQKVRGHDITVKASRPTRYELDGGARKPTRRIHAMVEPAAITVCVGRDEGASR
jgi:diacylglycerol kinase family enzyme